jgi:hypothetical protein
MKNFLQSIPLRWRKVVVIVLVLTPLVGLIVLLAKYAVNVPFWDQWELVPLISNMQHGALTFAQLFAQHNEHRIFFPRIIMLTLAALTHWNTLFEVAINVVLAIGTFCLMAHIAWRSLTSTTARVVAVVGISVMLFSPSQYENWLWGWQIQWFLNVLGLTAAVWALGVWRAKMPVRFTVAAIAATVATFSLASGFLVWFVCIPLLLRKQVRPWLWVWLALGVAATAAYYIGYQQPADSSGLYFVSHIPQFVAYLLTYLSLPIAFQMKTALLIGGVYVIAALTLVVIAWRRYGQKWLLPLLPWLCIALYGMFGALTTAISRVGFGVDQAYSSRYDTISCLIAIALFVAGIKLWEVAPQRLKRQLVVAGVIFGLLICANYAKGIAGLRERHNWWVEARQCAHSAQNVSDPCLTKLYPNSTIVWPRLEYLRSIHWGGL